MENLEFPITKKEAERQGIEYSAEKNRDAAFPTKLRDLRNEKGISQAALSKTLGLSKSTIGLYETGDTLPDAKTLKELAEYFQVSTDYLVGLSDAKTIDSDILSACRVTGLSEEAVKMLLPHSAVRVREGEFSNSKDYLATLSLLISNPKFFPGLIADICVHYDKHAEVERLAKEKEAAERKIDRTWGLEEFFANADSIGGPTNTQIERAEDEKYASEYKLIKKFLIVIDKIVQQQYEKDHK